MKENKPLRKHSNMRHIILGACATAMLLLAACSGGSKYQTYRGLSFELKAEAMADSLVARGFVIDTTQQSPDFIVLNKDGERYAVTILREGDGVGMVREDYTVKDNDESTALYWEMRKTLEKELGFRPGMKMDKEGHKDCVFQTKAGDVDLMLENTYVPTFYIEYKQKEEKK